MNLEEPQPPLPEQPIPLPLPIPVRFSTCDRHPDQNFTSFCASCLRERLTLLEPSLSASSSSTSAARAAGAAIKGIFQKNKASGGGIGGVGGQSSSCSVLPELRRSKSFSGGRGEGFSGVLVPQRKSCDVRGRSSLWGLFNAEDERKVEALGEIEPELGFSGAVEPVIESNEEEITEEIEEEVIGEDPRVSTGEGVEEIEAVEEKELGGEEEKTMKDHIEHDSQNKKPPRDLKEIAGSFWVAASVFSKKLQKWRRKEKTKKGKGGGDGRDGGSAAMRVEKPYSEIADYGYGRRSIDIDPRYSLDAGRMSFDDPRYSWDAPRASWDGFLTGRAFPRVPPPMISLVEHACVSVPRVDNQIPVEEPRISVHEDAATPGGTLQTRDYYSSESSSSQRRRKSFERSNSIRSKAAAVVAELDDPKLVSNAKVSPTVLDPFTGPKLHLTDKDLKNFKSNSHRDDYSESFVSTFRDTASVTGGLERKGSTKKSRRWGKAWNIWGLIYKRGGNKDEEEERYSRGNKVERSLSESWSEFRREPKVEPKGALNRILRSNSSVSSRNSFDMGSSFSTTRKNAAQANGYTKKKEPVLDRNRSARFSSVDFDNSNLRYLTPMKSGRRNGLAKNVPKNSHPTASSIARLY